MVTGANNGIVNVTITDDLANSQTAAFTATVKGYNINSTANNNSIGVTGTSVADTIVAGSGDDTLTLGLGADTVTGGSGADDFIDTIFSKDVIKDFTVAQSDQIGGIDVSDFATAYTTLTLTKTATTDVGAGAVKAENATISAAFDLGGTAADTNLLRIGGDYADAAAVQVAMRANVSAATATTATEGFLITFDNGTNTYLAVVDYDAIEADGDLLAAATVTTIATLEGVADNQTILNANFINFVA